MTSGELATIEARIRAFEARTGAEAVAAVVARSDRYHGLRWRAFAFGASLAALAAVAFDVVRPDWSAAHVSLATAVAILTAGLTGALLAIYVIGYPIAKLWAARQAWYAKAAADLKAKGTATVGGMVITAGGSSSGGSSGAAAARAEAGRRGALVVVDRVTCGVWPAPGISR